MTNKKLKKIKNNLLGKRNGIDGKDGYTPVKGKDYFDGKDGKDGQAGINGIDGRDGKDGANGRNGRDGIDGRNGKDGYTPIKNKDYFDGKDGRDGKDGINGKDGNNGQNGKDANEDKILNVLIEKMTGALDERIKQIEEELTESEKSLLKKLETKLAMMVQRLQVHGGGYSKEEIMSWITGSAAGMSRTDLSSQCNGVNLVFTMAENYKSGTIVLYYSSFPWILKPGTDFTETAANQITINVAEIPAPKAGQTFVGIYEKL